MKATALVKRPDPRILSPADTARFEAEALSAANRMFADAQTLYFDIVKAAVSLDYQWYRRDLKERANSLEYGWSQLSVPAEIKDRFYPCVQVVSAVGEIGRSTLELASDHYYELAQQRYEASVSTCEAALNVGAASEGTPNAAAEERYR